MTKKRWLILLTYLVVLSGGVLGGVLVSGRLGGAAPRGERDERQSHSPWTTFAGRPTSRSRT